MNDQLARPTLFGRIGNLFRRGQAEDLAEMPRTMIEECTPVDLFSDTTVSVEEPVETRTTFLRPWAKREQTIDQLQNGVAALSELMNSIRANLERQSQRQDEMLQCFSHWPQALQTLPESNRVQGEALKAIQQGIAQQNTQQGKVGDVLERMNRAEETTGRTLNAVRERVDMISMHEEAIGRSLTTVGQALQNVSTNSETSANVLANLSENIISRDSELERVIRRQNTRFTTMLTVAIVMSMAALTAVVVFGYLGYETLSRVAK